MTHDYKRYPELTNRQLQEEGFNSPHEQITSDFKAVVERVVDGDTIRVSCDFRDFIFPVRLINVDAPEMSEGGEVAKEWLKTQIEGQEVEILVNAWQRVGKYGRLLGRVISGGMDMGETMMSMGIVVAFEKRENYSIPRLGEWLGDELWS